MEMVNENEVYQEKVRAQLQIWQHWVDQWVDQGNAQPGGITVATRQHIDMLEEHFSEIRNQLDALCSSRLNRRVGTHEVLERSLIALKQILDASSVGVYDPRIALNPSRKPGDIYFSRRNAS